MYLLLQIDVSESEILPDPIAIFADKVVIATEK